MLKTKKLDKVLAKEIKRIEKTAYPKQMRALQGENAQGILEYCRDEENDEAIVYLGTNWYILAGVSDEKVEVVDFASTGMVGSEMFLAFKDLIETLGTKELWMSCRETTSYPLVLALVKRYGGRIKTDYVDRYSFQGEVMHDLVIWK